VRVVSMPSTDVFDAQSGTYQESVLPHRVRARVAVEAGTKDGWYKYVGLDGQVIGMDQFGASAPYKTIFEFMGITVEKIVEAVRKKIMKGVDEQVLLDCEERRT